MYVFRPSKPSIAKFKPIPGICTKILLMHYYDEASYLLPYVYITEIDDSHNGTMEPNGTGMFLCNHVYICLCLCAVCVYVHVRYLLDCVYVGK